MVQAASTVTGQSVHQGALLSTALKNIPAIQTVFPANNGLASQLKQVAQVIAARSALSVNRQIFFCSLGGFDTHSDQLPTQAALVRSAERGDGRILSGHQRAGRGEQRHHLHAFGVQPHLSARLEQRHGPCLGWTSTDDGRRGKRETRVRTISDAHTGRSGRYREAMAAGFRPPRSISMPPRWRLGLGWRAATCRAFSRIWRISRHQTWDFWVSQNNFTGHKGRALWNLRELDSFLA